MKKLTL